MSRPSEALPASDPLTDEHLVIDRPVVDRDQARLVVSGVGYLHLIDPDGERLTGDCCVGPQSVSLALDVPLGAAVAASSVVRYEQVGSPTGPVEQALILADGRIVSWLEVRDRSAL